MLAWWLVLALLMLGALAGAAPGAAHAPSWEWRAEHAWAQPWRWWTAAWVHLHPAHLAGNLVAAGVLAWAGAVARLPVSAAVAAWMAWPLTHLALVLDGRLAGYAGASGVLHACTAILALHWLAGPERSRRERGIGALVLAGLAWKLWREAAWRVPVLDQGLFPVAPAGHLSGVLAGLACAWLAFALVRREVRTAP